jgi:alkylhydroperoxidase family enzyme
VSGCASTFPTSSTTRPKVSNALWRALAAEWTAEQLIELIALAGFYHLISFTTNALQIPRESYGARFPAR